MKKFSLLLFALWATVSLVNAQDNQAIVYLKTGEIVKGVIIERKWDVSLKIKTADGFILAFRTDDISKIVKEGKVESFIPADIAAKKMVRTNGYRGFFDFGGAFSPISFNGYGSLSFETAHGYQINPYFFLGVGLSADILFRAKVLSVPIFGDFRVNFINKPITPFFDTRIGYSVCGGNGFYVNPNLGVSFGFNKKIALTAGIGYTRRFVETEVTGYYYAFTGSGFVNNVCFKLGVEF